MKSTHLFIDQHGNRYYARTVKELRAQIGGGGSRVGRMYADKKDGRTVAVGYVIADQWLNEYAPVEVPA